MHTRLVWCGASGQCKQSGEHYGVSHVSVSPPPPPQFENLPLWFGLVFDAELLPAVVIEQAAMPTAQANVRITAHIRLGHVKISPMQRASTGQTNCGGSHSGDPVEHRAQLSRKVHRGWAEGPMLQPALPFLTDRTFAIIVYTIVTRPLLRHLNASLRASPHHLDNWPTQDSI
jgi:hypothetical protein